MSEHELTVDEFVERLRHRADMVEQHGLDTDDETINQRNEWNVGIWRSVANEMEALMVDD